MIKGFLKQETKRDLNTWINQGNKIFSKLDFDKKGEYQRILADSLHLQVDEARKVLSKIIDQKRELNAKKAK
jgi:hypothetical protein